MKKYHILLGMYDDFLAGLTIKINVFCSEYNISVSTFRRYIACLRDYLTERSNKEIVYHPDRCGYVMEEKKVKKS